MGRSKNHPISNLSRVFLSIQSILQPFVAFRPQLFLVSSLKHESAAFDLEPYCTRKLRQELSKSQNSVVLVLEDLEKVSIVLGWGHILVLLDRCGLGL